MFHRILLTNDGSPLAASGIPYAAALARSGAGEVVVLRVSHVAGAAVSSIGARSWQNAIDAREPASPVEAEPHLSEIVSRLRDAGVARVGSLLVNGTPSEAIPEVAERLAADLIVMSSHGLSGMRRAVLGSVADHVARHVGQIPVLICHPQSQDADGLLDRIIVPLDGSESAKAALLHARGIAEAVEGELTLVRSIASVHQLIASSMPIDSGVGVAIPLLTVEAAEEIVAQKRGLAREELVDVATELAMAGFTHTHIEIIEELPANAILAAARRADSRLIVMTTHGRGGMQRVLLGSVSDEVVRNVDGGAVLLVRPTA